MLFVLIFLSADCPLARLYEPVLSELSRTPGVQFVGVVQGNRPTSLPFPTLIDPEARLAQLVGATRTPEAVVLDSWLHVRYRGRIDDQFGISFRRPKPTREDLKEAINDLLAGRAVQVPRTQAEGCLITRPLAIVSAERVTYSRHIAPILQAHCVSCHRPGQIGPFSLLTYRSAKARADLLLEAISEGRMPPWPVKHGRFKNDPSLSAAQKQSMREWVEAGCPEGDPLPPAPSLPDDWAFGKPDLVIPIPKPVQVPASGVMDYQFFMVDLGTMEDDWIQAAELRPTNRSVVHHANVFLVPRTGLITDSDQSQWRRLVTMVPGSPGFRLPFGLAKRIPARWKLIFEIHYAPIGSAQVDQTELGLWFAPPPKHEVKTLGMAETNLRIPPHCADYRVEQTFHVSRETILLSMQPHMHLRGKSFEYEAIFPDGRTEKLLLAQWDFNWQYRYEPIAPITLPIGTVLRFIGIYDNSSANPNNPDSTMTVLWGRQSSDEMFNAFFDVVELEPALWPVARSLWPVARSLWPVARSLWPVGAILVIWLTTSLMRPKLAQLKRGRKADAEVS